MLAVAPIALTHRISKYDQKLNNQTRKATPLNRASKRSLANSMLISSPSSTQPCNSMAGDILYIVSLFCVRARSPHFTLLKHFPGLLYGRAYPG